MDAGSHRGAEHGPAAPRTALVVGVTSHRDLAPGQLPELRRRLKDVFSALRDRFPELQLVVLSPLAEGGDRLVAEAGLAAGARLIVPLPLPAQVYAQDFPTAQSRAQFEYLLEQAEVVALPLPDGEDGIEALHVRGVLRDRQYLLAGLYVASHCHVLFALWDGSDAGGTGGTAQIVRYYLGAWYSILLRAGFPRKLTILDAFAGPGIYPNGRPGSPIIIIAGISSVIQNSASGLKTS